MDWRFCSLGLLIGRIMVAPSSGRIWRWVVRGRGCGCRCGGRWPGRQRGRGGPPRWPGGWAGWGGGWCWLHRRGRSQHLSSGSAELLSVGQGVGPDVEVALQPSPEGPDEVGEVDLLAAREVGDLLLAEGERGGGQQVERVL